MHWNTGSTARGNASGEATDECSSNNHKAFAEGRAVAPVIGRVALVAIVGLSGFLAATARASRGAPLGKGHVAFELSHLSFTDLQVSNGGYLALEGFGRLAPRLYIGGAAGFGGTIGVLGDEATLIPLEVNAKYVPFVARRLVVALGAGAAVCNVTHTDKDNLFGFIKIRTREETLFGGQVFVDMAFVFDSVSLGVNAKYQITQDSGAGWSASTFRLGLRINYLL